MAETLEVISGDFPFNPNIDKETKMMLDMLDSAVIYSDLKQSCSCSGGCESCYEIYCIVVKTVKFNSPRLINRKSNGYEW